MLSNKHAMLVLLNKYITIFTKEYSLTLLYLIVKPEFATN